MTTQRRKRHRPGQIVRKLWEADAMLNAGQHLDAVLQALKISKSSYHRCHAGRGSQSTPGRQW